MPLLASLAVQFSLFSSQLEVQTDDDDMVFGSAAAAAASVHSPGGGRRVFALSKNG